VGHHATIGQQLYHRRLICKTVRFSRLARLLTASLAAVCKVGRSTVPFATPPAGHTDQKTFDVLGMPAWTNNDHQH